MRKFFSSIILSMVAICSISCSHLIDRIGPPKPVIVSSGMKANSYGMADIQDDVYVYAVIRNDGGTGVIVFEAELTQFNDTTGRKKKETFSQGETKKMLFTFSAPLGSLERAHYKVKAYPYIPDQHL